MSDTAPIRSGESLDWQQLETYLRGVLPDLPAAPMRVSQFHGGHANLTYQLQFGDREMVLRRPPFGKIAPGAHDMGREFRVLSKLRAHYNRAPRAYHYTEDETIIGAKFVVMERRHGVVVRYRVPKVFAGAERAEERLTRALIDALADLHTIDVAANGLGELGRPDGFLQRQLGGWTKRWNLSKTEDNPTMDRVGELLAERLPASKYVSVIHNDFKLDNCQFLPHDPDRVSAVFDWDMTTLGDPLADFGSALSYWPDSRVAPEKNPVNMRGTWPDKQFLIDHYAARTGFDLAQLDWYHAFAYWKNAIILQQLYQRYQLGKTQDPRMAKLGVTAVAFGEVALDLL